jgi:hypothetical protein
MIVPDFRPKYPIGRGAATVGWAIPPGYGYSAITIAQ